MNRPALMGLIAIVLLTIVGCVPRHPPHTPQPLGVKGETVISASKSLIAFFPPRCVDDRPVSQEDSGRA
jgi:hypothetical protein